MASSPTALSARPSRRSYSWPPRVSEMKKSDSEKSLLLFSLCMGVFFAVLGVAWGVVIQSGVVLFDGIYSGISIILTMLSILATRVINQPDDDTFQFGRSAFEPLVVAFRSIVIVAICSYGIVTALLTIQSGGRLDTDSAGGIYYGLVSMVACLFSWYYLKRKGEGMPDIVQAESEQWLLDTVLSAAVTLSFILAYLLSMTRFAGVVPYIDPLTVILGSLYFVRLPLARLFSSVKQLLLVAPEDSIQQQLRVEVEAVAADHGFTDIVLRSSTVGRQLAVDIAFIDESDRSFQLSEMDTIRAELSDRLSAMQYDVWMTLSFTRDRRWA
jgi:predicted Co/Zn/Cd cation transporter (cation efflux family)